MTWVTIPGKQGQEKRNDIRAIYQQAGVFTLHRASYVTLNQFRQTPA
jgi:hypothetical protein